MNIRRLIKYFWSLRGQFGRYFIIGISGFVLDMGTLILFKEIFGILPTVAVLLNQVILISYIFLLNKCWTFKDKEVPHKQLVNFIILSIANYIIAVNVMYVFNHYLGFDYRLVRMGNIALSVSWNFFLYKYWVYKT